MNCLRCGCNPSVPDNSAPPIRSIIDRTPRFEALATSNAPPLDTEQSELQQKLSRAREYSANLDIRIAGVRHTLEALLAEKATVDEYVEQTEAIFHPLRTLPTDILGEIFSSFVENVRVCAETFDSSLVTGRFVDSRDIQNGPCVLAHVSSGWRHTALALPRLWSHIQLNFDRYNNDGSSESFLSEILSRSLSVPLHISLYASRDLSNHKALPTFLGTSGRWRSAGMSLPRSIFVALNSRITLHSLETVQIYLHSPSFGEPVSQDQSRIFERAHRLRTIVVNSDVTVFLDVFSVQWNRITHFTGVSTRSINSILRLFSNAVNLQHASFHQCGGTTTVGDGVGRTSSNIAYLQLGDSRAVILNNIDFPRLNVLHFAYAVKLKFPDPLRPSTGSAIRELSVAVTRRDAVPLVAFLPTVPNLDTLELCAVEYFDIGLLCMPVLVDRPGLVPKLHTLGLRGGGEPGVKVTERLVEMVKARRKSADVATLGKVVINRASFVTPDVVNAFEELVGQGLKVHWVRK